MMEFNRAEALEAGNVVQAEAVAKANAVTEHLRALLLAQVEESSTLREQISRLEDAKLNLEAGLKDALAPLLELAKGRPLRYGDIHSGLLARHVGALTYFPTAAQNDAFLSCVNIKTTGEDGDLGVCSRLLRYSAIVNRERSGLGPHRTSGEGLWGRPRVLRWKDEYLVYCTFVHAGWTEKKIAALFDIGERMVSGCVRTWAVFLDSFFQRTMPAPPRSEMLRQYPSPS